MNKAPKYHTPFWAAASNNQVEIMQLLEPFSDVDEANDEGDEGGFRPLSIASLKGHYEAVCYLLSLDGIDVNLTNYWYDQHNEHCKTALDFSLEGQHAPCVEILEEHGGSTYQEILTRLDETRESDEMEE